MIDCLADSPQGRDAPTFTECLAEYGVTLNDQRRARKALRMWLNTWRDSTPSDDGNTVIEYLLRMEGLGS